MLFFFASLVFILIWAIETFGRQFFYDYIRAETIPILGGRLEIWPIALDLIKNRPFFGYGFGVEEKIMGLRQIILRPFRETYIHNSYLGLLLQLGVLGFIVLFVPLFILLFKELFSKDDNTEDCRLKYALRASLIAGLICSIYESWIYSVGNGQVFPFWIMVMLLVFFRYDNRGEALPDTT